MIDVVLVTGAFGLVGTATVDHLAARGRRVIATDLDTPANRKAAAGLSPGVEVHWLDLTDSASVAALLSAVQPAAVVHLAAVIQGQLTVVTGGDGAAQVALTQACEVARPLPGLDEVGRQGRVRGDAAQVHASRPQREEGALGVVEHFGALLVGEPRAQCGAVSLRHGGKGAGGDRGAVCARERDPLDVPHARSPRAAHGDRHRP